jgi:hypothetical protein
MILPGSRSWKSSGARECSTYPEWPPLTLFRFVAGVNGHQSGWFTGFSPGGRYSKGWINPMKVSFFRVPSILWAMLPALSMMIVVGTTEMLP